MFRAARGSRDSKARHLRSSDAAPAPSRALTLHHHYASSRIATNTIAMITSVQQPTSELRSSSVISSTKSLTSYKSARYTPSHPRNLVTSNPAVNSPTHNKHNKRVIYAPFIPRDGKRFFHLSHAKHGSATSSTYTESMSDKERMFRYYMAKGTERYHAGALEESVQAYKNALKECPTSIDALTCTASVAEALGSYDVALDCSIKVLELTKKPDIAIDPVALANEYSRISRIYAKQGKLKEAHKLLREGVYIYPSDVLFKELENVEKQIGIQRILPTYSAEELHSDPFYAEIKANYPFEVRLTSDGRGRGLFATKDFALGDVVFYEAAITSAPDVENQRDLPYCTNCMRLITPVSFDYTTQEAKQFLESFPEEDNMKLRKEIETQICGFPIQQVKDELGNVYCSTRCQDEMWRNCLNYLAPYFQRKDPALKTLFPVHVAKDTPADSLIVRDNYSIEMMTKLIARMRVQPELWSKYLAKLVYADYDPPMPLLDHEVEQLKALRHVFPSQADFLTEQNFKRLKSIIEMNAFSIESESVTVGLDIGPEDEPPPPELSNSNSTEEVSSSRQLKLNIDINDEPIIRGHALFKVSSLMNHSCDPNIGLSTPNMSTYVAWVALRPIKRGEELLDSYIPLDETTEDRERRRQILFNNYKFWCECSYCKSGK